MDVKRAVQHLLAKVFRPFTKVEPQEVVTVVIMTSAAFLLLTAYYLLKTVREPLILLQGGAELKLYARAGQAVIMVGIIWAYGELARRVGRMKLLAFVFVFFLSNLAIFAFLARTDLQIGLAFFLWVGVFSYTVVAQVWALAADIYTEEQGKRLFPIIGAGSSIGAVGGARLAKAIVPYGPPVIMAVALGILIVCVAAIVWVERRTLDTRVRAGDAHPDEPMATEGAFHLLSRDKYLLLIAGLAVFLNWVNSSGEYLLDRILVMAAHDPSVRGAVSETTFIGAFKADYYSWYNLIGVLLQLFAVSRIFKVVGVRNALYFMPVFAFGAYGIAVLLPVLGVMRLVKIGENGLQYSLQETTRHALFLVASRVEKFVGKTAVDTVAVRIGAIMSAIMVMIGTSLGWATRTFAAIDVGLAVVWFGFAILVGREHKRRGAEDEAHIAEEPIGLHQKDPAHRLRLDAPAAPAQSK
jgi:AAA family ATP:ADP antiporter